MNRRIWTMLLALVLVISVVPMTAMAAECTCATPHVHDGTCGYVAAVGCDCNGNGAPYHAFNGGECTWVAGSPCNHVCTPAEPEQPDETPDETPCTHPNATYVESWKMWHCDDCSSWWSNQEETPDEPEETPDETPCTHPNATYVEPWNMWYCDDCHSWWEGDKPEAPEKPIVPDETPDEDTTTASTYGLDSVPKTGDNSAVILMGGMLCAVSCGAAAVYVCMKKRSSI